MLDRRWFTAMAWLCPAALSLFGCDPDATGIEDCREIERARCQAARHCDLGIDTDEQVAACERYMRDHCLHGVGLSESPSARARRSCVSALEAAGTCAERNGPSTLPSACAIDVARVRAQLSVCEVIQSPEELRACEFLIPEPPDDDDEDEDGGMTPAPDGGA